MHWTPAGWTVEHDGAGDPTTVFEGARAEAAARGGGRLTVWWTEPSPGVEEAAGAAGFSVGRDLLQLRARLPLPGMGSTEPLPVRSFMPGQDDEAWLAVNNRAFDWHPEQGGWTEADLQRRIEEPWFDAAGFLLHEIDGRLAGFCWTKIHRQEEPVLGEIYVIAVDPSYGGRGLGRRLTLAGLEHMMGRGVHVGMLFVDAANTGARALYDHMGFVAHHTNRSYVAEVPTNAPTA